MNCFDHEKLDVVNYNGSGISKFGLGLGLDKSTFNCDQVFLMTEPYFVNTLLTPRHFAEGRVFLFQFGGGVFKGSDDEILQPF